MRSARWSRVKWRQDTAQWGECETQQVNFSRVRHSHWRDNYSHNLKVTEIAFSFYPVTDMARARSFYEVVLGLKPTMVHDEAGGMQWTEYDIANGTLSIGAGLPSWQPRSDGCSVGLEIEDFDSAIAELKTNRVKFKMEAFPTPVCQMAMISDPDGNTICIHKRMSAHH